MPIYEYSCKKCGDFEVSQRMTDEALKKCPTCGAKVTKLISQSAFHLKGSGWYMTDYAKNGTNKGSGSSDSKSSSDTKEASSTSSSSETSDSSSTKEKTSPAKENTASA
ncbi:MAG: zinc ribbon domain-containing protein [Deltaproteobacteria bacterium]|nr:zinc ribbon domain-containing protein [Deltaproteobacteria bacterium]